MVVLEFLLQPEVLAVVVALIVFLIGWKLRKFLNFFRLVFEVWHLVERLGVLVGLKGYDKLAVFMEMFVDKFYEKYGREPDAGDEGLAVKIINLLCRLENKDEVEDFLEDTSGEEVTES